MHDALLAHTWERTLAALPPYLPATRLLLRSRCRLASVEGHHAVIRGPEGWIRILRNLRHQQVQRALSIATGRPMALTLQGEDPTA